MVKMIKLNTNYVVGNYIALLNLGIRRNVRSIRIVKTKMGIRLTKFLYEQGVLRSHSILPQEVVINFKYYHGHHVISRLSIVSRPGKRCYMTMQKLALIYNTHTFTGFYIVSTSQGLLSSDYCLTLGHIGGEVLVKVEL
jgi:ribosomal protein S8